MNVGEIKYLDFRAYAEVLHLGREIGNEGWRIFVNGGRKIDGSGGKRRHVRLEMQGRTARRLIAAPPARRELDNHAWAMLPKAFQNLSE